MKKLDLDDIKLILSDIDGVWTDGSLIYGGKGEELKIFNVRDGLAVGLLRSIGIEVGIVSGRFSHALQERVRELGIDLVATDVDDKRAACAQLMSRAKVTASETLYIGDDLNDLPAFDACGISVAVRDAAIQLQSAATIVLETTGGHGALRELTERIFEYRELDITATWTK